MNRLNEDEGAVGTSGDAMAHAPENNVVIVQQDEAKSSKLAERVAERKNKNKRNRYVLREKTTEKEEALPGVRYQLQSFTNGGTPIGYDEDGNPTDKLDAEVGQPSSYEKSRRELLDEKRKARLQQLKKDRERHSRTPDDFAATTYNRKFELDEQIDDMLYWWIETYGDWPK